MALSSFKSWIRGYTELSTSSNTGDAAKAEGLWKRSHEDYLKVKKRTIAIIECLPDSYLSREKKEAAVEAVRTGREPADKNLFSEVWDAAMAYQEFVKAQMSGKTKSE